MPVKMAEIKRSGRTIGFRAVDPSGRIAASFQVGKTVAGQKIASLEDARNRARAYVQARNLAERREQGKSAPPPPRRGR